MAIIAITTNNSIKVKPVCRRAVRLGWRAIFIARAERSSLALRQFNILSHEQSVKVIIEKERLDQPEVVRAGTRRKIRRARGVRTDQALPARDTGEI
jgi:hypothetical protein